MLDDKPKFLAKVEAVADLLCCARNDKRTSLATMIPDGETETDINCLNGNFLCGVVEGFYGRPWTTKQRTKLFQRMKTMGMNTYLYAPKDDCKHRMYWRELYSVEEADHLTGMIQSAADNDVLFVYALSPGLDMNYSSSKDVSYLKRKLQQVSSFACKAFALLFDDIEVDMCEGDKQMFQSFAHAQVSVTNEVFQHLEQPGTFLFCPTEYCASRAVPSVQQSEYLNTIGNKLLPGIDVMWTGAKVITKNITLESIQEIATVLQRPPVIWDNIHANDYDQKRLFLGPYEGRSPELIPYLRGVLTNPNCEFEANFVAMHTLAQWSRSSMDMVKKDILLSSSPCSADIKLETQGDSSSDAVPYHSYQPKVALKLALQEWLAEFSYDCDAPKFSAKRVTPVVPLSSVLTDPETTPSIPLAIAASLGVSNINKLNGIDALMQPQSGPAVNSLVNPLSSDSESETSCLEPMDCVSSPSCSPVVSVEDAEMLDIDSAQNLTCDELALLVDLFYMPFEHGCRGVQMLQDFYWLKCSSYAVSEVTSDSTTSDQLEAAAEWHVRAQKFEDDVKYFDTALEHLCEAPNKALLFDLYPYIWDMKVSLALAVTYLKWLGVNKTFKVAFTSGEQEPWLFRGGLQSEFQRLLPLEGVLDLTAATVPTLPISHNYMVHPYLAHHKQAVYDVCRKTCDDGADATDIFPFHNDLVADKLIGAFLEQSPEYCFVIEDTDGYVCGYVLAALDSKVHMTMLEEVWIPSIQEKYAKPDGKTGGELTPAEEMICSVHSHKSFISLALFASHPSIIRVDVLPERCTDSASRQALASAIAALKTNGSTGIYAEVHVGDRNTIDRYSRLSMFDTAVPSQPDDLVIVARTL